MSLLGRCAPYTENIFAALSGGYAHERLKGSNMKALLWITYACVHTWARFWMV